MWVLANVEWCKTCNPACNIALTKLDATTNTRLYHSPFCGVDTDIDVGTDGGGSIKAILWNVMNCVLAYVASFEMNVLNEKSEFIEELL